MTVTREHRATGGPAPRPRPRPRHRFRRAWQAALGIVLAVILCTVYSMVAAATTPGNYSFQAKWADWLRGHHLSAVAAEIEKAYYATHAPKKGGRPAHLNAVPHSPPVPSSSASPTSTSVPAGAAPTTKPAAPPAPPHLPAPAPVPLVVHPALPGEGKWQPAGPLVHGVPGMYVSQFRADNVYTSQITSAVWMDPTLLRLHLVPGSQEPGGTWSQPPYIDGAELPTAVAAFNGGFRMQDAHGGFYLDGHTAVPLVNGAASLVLYRSGRVNVGVWGSQVRMTPDVVAVMQNLVPIVDNGQPAPSATYNDTQLWGSTLGASTVVARSGVGVTRSGAVVYVAGPALTARSLAESLVRAGAVRAMTLDINPEWVTFNFFSHSAGHPAQVSASKLYPEMQRPATRYLGPIWEARDFVMVSDPNLTSAAG